MPSIMSAYDNGGLPIRVYVTDYSKDAIELLDLPSDIEVVLINPDKSIPHNNRALSVPQHEAFGLNIDIVDHLKSDGIDRAIKLDTDVIVQSSLVELLEWDLRGKTLGAVPRLACGTRRGEGIAPGDDDYKGIEYPLRITDYNACERLYGKIHYDAYVALHKGDMTGFSDCITCIPQGGMILYDLTKWSGSRYKAFSMMYGAIANDEEYLGIVHAGDICVLPDRFNFVSVDCTSYKEYDADVLLNEYRLQHEAAVVHYNGYTRPWVLSNASYYGFEHILPSDPTDWDCEQVADAVEKGDWETAKELSNGMLAVAAGPLLPYVDLLPIKQREQANEFVRLTKIMVDLC